MMNSARSSFDTSDDDFRALWYGLVGNFGSQK